MESNNLIYAFEFDDNGHIIESHFIDAETNQNDRMITTEIPRGIFKPKWTGSKWIEGATSEEIEELTKPQPHVPTDSEILGQQMTERELEAIVQGQQITDMDLRLFMVEMGANQ